MKCTYNVTMRSVRATIVAVENLLVLHNLSVFVGWGMQHAVRIRRIIMWPEPLRKTFSTFSHKWHD